MLTSRTVENTVSVIATASNTVVATIPVGGNPIAFGKFIGGKVGAKAFLSPFPLKDKNTSQFLTPYNAPIISVFDQKMESSKHLGVVHLYGCDGKILAFTGDEGLKIYGADSLDCKQPGYENNARTSFSLAGVNYKGTVKDGPIYLEYDGHPGYDYRGKLTTPVFAATSGTIFYPLEAVGMVKSGDPNRAYSFTLWQKYLMVPLPIVYTTCIS